MKPVPNVPLSAGARGLAIARILEARFMLTVFEQVRDGAPEYWASPGALMARGVFDHAMIVKKWLQGASDAMLFAALAAIQRR